MDKERASEERDVSLADAPDANQEIIYMEYSQADSTLSIKTVQIYNHVK